MSLHPDLQRMVDPAVLMLVGVPLEVPRKIELKVV